jgi:hypothetical protein
MPTFALGHNDIESKPGVDVHPLFGSAAVSHTGLHGRLQVNGKTWRTWETSDWPYVRRAKWIADNSVAIWIVPSPTHTNCAGAVEVSESGERYLDVGFASDMFFSANYIFATYSEDANLASEPGDKEYNIVSVFSRGGRFLFGLEEIIRNKLGEGAFFDLAAGCVGSADEFFFVSAEEPKIWTLDPKDRSITPIVSLLGKRAYVCGITCIDGFLYLLIRDDDRLAVEQTSLTTLQAVDSFSFSLRELFELPAVESERLSVQEIRGQGFRLSYGGRAGVLYLDR